MIDKVRSILLIIIIMILAITYKVFTVTESTNNISSTKENIISN